MKKTVVKSDRLILGLVLKAVISSVIFLLLFDFAASEIIYKMDLSLESAQIASIFVCSLTALCVSFVTCHGIKNNAFVIGILSEVPLVFYSLINLIFNDTSVVYFFIKLAIILLFGALGGILSMRRAARFKV